MVQTRPAATAGALAELPGAPSPFDDGLQTLRDVEPVWHLVVQGLALEAMVKPFFVAAYPGLVGEPQYVPMMLKYSTTTDMEKRGHDATAEELFAETQANIISWAEEFVPLSGYSLRGSFLEIYPHKKKRPFGEIELPNSLAAVTRVVDGMLQIKKAVPDAEWRKDVAEAAVKCAIAVWTGIGIALGVAPEARRPWIVNPEDCGGEEVSAHTDIKGLAAVGIYSSEQVLGQRQLNEAGKAFVLALGKTKFLWSGPKSEQDSAFPVPSVAHLPVKNAVEHLLPYEVFDSPSRTDVNAAGTIMNPGTTWPLLTSTGSDEKFLTAVDMLPDVISLASRTTKQARERVYAYLAQQNAARRTPTPGSTGGSGCAEDGIVMPYRPGPMAEGGTGSGSGTSDATSTLCVRVPGFDLARREAAAPPPEDRPG
ncbi:unnamed protein product [Amoebophrya sp. A120]|nr:unnamed protein product [Amoebophrya sp. A120]|eukprot:GSA120T00013373001.1